MARNLLTGDIEIEDPHGGASLNGAQAPEGSAERVRDGEADGNYAETMHDVEEPITVTDYDANGEAIDVVVDTTPELPGFEAAPERWPRFEGRRVAEVVLAFAGQCEIPDGVEYELGRRLTLTVSGTVASVKHASKEARGPVKAIVALSVDESQALDGVEAEELRDRIQSGLSLLGGLAGEPAEDMEQRVREVIAALNGTPLPEPEPAEDDEPDALPEDTAADDEAETPDESPSALEQAMAEVGA